MASFTSMSLYLASLFFTLVLGVPLEPRTVFDPPITSPTSSSVWTVGKVETVTWNATGIPAGVQGKIQLGFLTSESENLSQVLAQGFNLTDEKVDITVPDVVSRTNYIVVLFGDSGNISPKFTIQGGSASESGGGSGASSTTSTAAPSARTNTASPPIATAPLSSAPESITATAPGSTSTPSTSSSSAASSASLSPSLPTSSSLLVPSPSPSPSTSAGWSTNKLQLFQAVLVPAAAALMLVL